MHVEIDTALLLRRHGSDMHSKPGIWQSCNTKYNLNVLHYSEPGKLKNILAQETLETFTNTQNAEQAYTELNKILQDALDTVCPIVQSRSQKNNTPKRREQEKELMRLKEVYITALNK